MRQKIGDILEKFLDRIFGWPEKKAVIDPEPKMITGDDKVFTGELFPSWVNVTVFGHAIILPFMDESFTKPLVSNFWLKYLAVMILLSLPEGTVIPPMTDADRKLLDEFKQNPQTYMEHGIPTAEVLEAITKQSEEEDK